MFCCLKNRKSEYAMDENENGSRKNSEDKTSLRNGSVTISDPIPIKDGASLEPDSVYENQNQIPSPSLEHIEREHHKKYLEEKSAETENAHLDLTKTESGVKYENVDLKNAGFKTAELKAPNDNDIENGLKYENVEPISNSIPLYSVCDKTKNVAKNINEVSEDFTKGRSKAYENVETSENSVTIVDNLSDSFITDLKSSQPPDLVTEATTEDLTNQLESAQQEVALTLQEAEDFEFDEMSQEMLNNAVSRLESVAARLEALSKNVGVAAPSGASTASSDSGEAGPSVMAYDELLSGPFAKFVSLSDRLDSDIKHMVSLVEKSFKAQRNVVHIAAQSQKPALNVMLDLFKPLNTCVAEVQSFRESKRAKREIENHLACLSESIGALGWVGVEPTPVPYIKEMKDSGVFYSNRILKEFKEKDANQVEWVKSWNAILDGLQAYVKQHHTTGLTWNPKGRAVTAGGAPPPPPVAGVPPPPPPGGIPPPPPPGAPAPASSGGNVDASALFNQINKGADISKGLKRVTDDMKTHKNPTLRQGPAPYKPPLATKPVKGPSPPKAAVTKPPVLELQNGKKWIVEYQVDNKNMVIDKTEMRHTVYIYKCVNSTIQIKGKVNSIIMDSCKKCGIVFDDILSSIEFVNCQSVQGQVMGKVNTVSVDKTDGCMIYLSKESLNAEIVTAKSSEMNILVPTDDGDMKEFALPEQFKTIWNGKTFETTMTDSV